MQLFITVLTDGDLIPAILQKLSDFDYHGSVLSTKSIHKALDSVEPDPYFGGINKVMNEEEVSRPMIFVVVKEDDEVKRLAKLVKEAVGEFKDKGFMYSLPISFLEGLDD